LDAEITCESEADDRGDFVDYLARRLGVEAREARARLSAWLVTYEPPAKSGPRRAVPQEPCEQSELARSA
jgi:hypothetical protein